MPLELNIQPGFVPSPGTTLVASVFHRIVDEATVTATGDITNTGPFDVYTTKDPTIRPSIQSIVNSELAIGQTTEMSLTGVMADNLYKKDGVCFYSRGVSGDITKGMPVFHHYNLGPNLAIGSNVTMIDTKNALEGYNFPVVHGDLRGITTAVEGVSECGITVPKAAAPLMIAVQDTTASLGVMEVAYKGEVEALVHTSSNLVTNALYAVHHTDIGGKYYQIPVAWNGVNTGTTQMYVPWGLVKSINTTATTVLAPIQSATHSLAAQSYYVANIFLWGEPCL